MSAPPPRRPRIGVSGASGTGKSSLARALAGRLALPYLEEGMRRRLEAGLDLHRLGHAQHRDLHGELLAEMRAGTDAAIASHGGFVCDRSPLDMAAFWLYYRFAFDLAATEDFMAAADAALTHFDLVVLLPRGAIPLEDDGVRSANPWVQLHFEALLEAMVARSAGAVPVLRLERDCVACEARVAAVLGAPAAAPPVDRGAGRPALP